MILRDTRDINQVEQKNLNEKYFLVNQKIDFENLVNSEIFRKSSKSYIIYKEKVPQKASKTWILLIFVIFGGTFTAPTGGTVGVPRRHSLRLYIRYDIKNRIFKKIRNVSFFRTILKEKIYHFFENFRKPKNQLCISKSQLFLKKSTFFDFSFFFEKVTF